MGAGRYAPSPSGDLHLGNLRTALLAWLFARSTGRDFVMRVEDLDDRTQEGADARQLRDLADLGIDWDGAPVRQSERRDIYADVVAALERDGRTFACFCSRKDITEAPRAPHTPPGAYPGTCRHLTRSEVFERAARRPAAIRLRSDVATWSVHDDLHGEVSGAVDDFALVRNDGTPAYNLAVVVDDALQGVDQVVRGDDLLSSAPRQAYLTHLLGYVPPTYAHVPLVLNPDGQRIAKRDGAVSATELRNQGKDPHRLIAESLGFATHDPFTMLAEFDPQRLPREPWVFRAE